MRGRAFLLMAACVMLGLCLVGCVQTDVPEPPEEVWTAEHLPPAVILFPTLDEVEKIIISPSDS